MEQKLNQLGRNLLNVGTTEKNILRSVSLDDGIECGGGDTDVSEDGGHIGMLMGTHGIGGVGDGVVIGTGVGIGTGTGGDGDGGDGVGGGGDFTGIGGTGTVDGSGIYTDGGGHIGTVTCIVIGHINGTGTRC